MRVRSNTPTVQDQYIHAYIHATEGLQRLYTAHAILRQIPEDERKLDLLPEIQAVEKAIVQIQEGCRC